MMQLTGVVYDLDGTLIDSAANIVAAVNRARGRYGLESLPQQVVQPYIGEGSRRLVERALFGCVSPGYHPPVTVLDANEYPFDEVYAGFIEGYLADPVGGIDLYDGVKTALSFFYERGIPQSVLTNKPHEVTVAVVDALALTPYFSHVLGPGGVLDGFNVVPKPDPGTLSRIIAAFGVAPEGVWMVGDGIPDVRVAQAVGVPSLGLQGGLYPADLLPTLDPPPTIVRSNFRTGFEFLKTLL